MIRKLCKKKFIWKIFNTTVLLISAKYLLIALQYCHFAYLSTFPLQNVSKIVQEISVHGVTTTSPVNNVHRQTNLIYTAQNVCKASITLLIVIKSKASYFEQRNTIRRTWGKWSDEKTKYVFILGYDKNVVDITERESRLYNDIVQGDFVDSYGNNTYKTIFTYNWISEYCRQTDYVLFADDDFFVHIPNILQYIEDNSIGNIENIMYGGLMYMARPIRDKRSKWFVNENEYPYKFWFPYLTGGSILTNIRVVRNINIAIPYVQFVSIDDAFIGIVANRIDIRLEHDSGFGVSSKTQPENINGCLTSHGYRNSIDLISAWKA